MALDDKHVAELVQFLMPSARADLKYLSMHYVLGISGTVSGREYITSNPVIIDRIVALACDTLSNVVRDAIACLINISGDDVSTKLILTSSQSGLLLDALLSSVVLRDCLLADPIAMLLANISRTEEGAERLVRILTSADPPSTFDQLVLALCQKDLNPQADLHFLASFLANMSQIEAARIYMLDRNRCIIQRLLAFTQHASDIRRQGISVIIKNCCFETHAHDWLLGNAVDIVPALLLPLAGPEPFDDDDVDKFPPELQYLEPSKTRESVAAIRRTLVEALIQLCATKAGRKYMKDRNVYLIIREYHKWEQEGANIPAIINLIDLLIGDEPEPHLPSNLKQIQVPFHYQQKFDQEEEELNRAFSDDLAPS